MRLVARLRSGRLVYYAAGVFYMDGNGTISRARMSKLDKDGSVEWLDDDMRVDFRTQTGSYGPKAPHAAPAEDTHRFDALGAVKKLGIAAAMFVVFWSVVAGLVVFQSARSVAQERATEAHEAEALKARTAYTPYYDLAMATENGLTLGRYTPALERAQSALKQFDPENPSTVEVAKRLAEAERFYAGADDVWKIATQPGAKAEFASFKADRGDLGLTTDEPEDAVQELWGHGYDHVAGALAELEAYESVEPQSGRMSRPKVTMAQISAVIWEKITRADPPTDPEPTKTASVAGL